MSAPHGRGPFWMTDAPAIPRGVRAKIRWVIDHHPWIWLLVAVEQFVTWDILRGAICLFAFLVNLFIYEMWERISLLATRVTGRWMAFAFIIIGAACLTAGIIILAKFPSDASVSIALEKPSKLSSPIVLSDEEKQFRFNLRTFILSNLQEQANAFTQLAGRLSNPDSNTVFIKDRESTVAAGVLLDSLLRNTYDINWIALRKQADTTIEEMDIGAVMDKAKNYFKSYNESQVYFRNFLLLAGLDPTQKGMLANWIDVDARAAQAFNNLVTSPLSGEFAHTGFIPASKRFAVYLTAPNETSGK